MISRALHVRSRNRPIVVERSAPCCEEKNFHDYIAKEHVSSDEFDEDELTKIRSRGSLSHESTKRDEGTDVRVEYNSSKQSLQPQTAAHQNCSTTDGDCSRPLRIQGVLTYNKFATMDALRDAAWVKCFELTWGNEIGGKDGDDIQEDDQKRIEDLEESATTIDRICAPYSNEKHAKVFDLKPPDRTQMDISGDVS